MKLSDDEPIDNLIIIRRTLRGTRFEIVIGLTPEELAHLELVTRKRVTIHMPLDINMLKAMGTLARHFEKVR